jgi:hypothetical protein
VGKVTAAERCGRMRPSTTSEGEPEMELSEYSQDIAKVEQVELGYEDHGILTCMLRLAFGSSGQGAGGYALDAYDEELKRRVGTAYGMEFVIRTMRACGVNEWSKIKGRTIFALRDPADPTYIKGIAPLPTEPGEPFVFDELRAMANA